MGKVGRSGSWLICLLAAWLAGSLAGLLSRWLADSFANVLACFSLLCFAYLLAGLAWPGLARPACLLAC